MDEIAFRRIVFASVLSIQYHPRNEIPPGGDLDVIERCLRITNLACLAFNNFHFHDCCDVDHDDIPF